MFLGDHDLHTNMVNRPEKQRKTIMRKKTIRMFTVALHALLALSACDSNQGSRLADSSEFDDGSFEVSCAKSDTGAKRFSSDAVINVYEPSDSSEINDARFVSDSCKIRALSQNQGLRISRLRFEGVTMNPEVTPVFSATLAGEGYAVDLPTQAMVDFNSSIDNADFQIGCPGMPSEAELRFSVKGAVVLDRIALVADFVACQ